MAIPFRVQGRALLADLSVVLEQFFTTVRLDRVRRLGHQNRPISAATCFRKRPRVSGIDAFIA